ncbi:MAG: hypothetical protein ACRD92_08530 [Nitrosopumilaceae archaeon]
MALNDNSKGVNYSIQILDDHNFVVSGTVDDIIKDLPVTMQIVNQLYQVIHINQTIPDESGNFSFKVTKQGPLWRNVEDYFIKINYSPVPNESEKPFCERCNGNSTGIFQIVIDLPDSPLKQFKSGISAEKIQCKEGLQLIKKPENGLPACVKPTTAIRLVERHWNILINQFFAKDRTFDEVINFKNDTNHYDTISVILGFLQYTTITDNIPHFLFYTLDENYSGIKYKQDIVIYDYNQKYLPPEQLAQFIWWVYAESDAFSITGIVDARTGNIIGVEYTTTFRDKFPQ